MGRPEIYIEHSDGEKVRKHLRVRPEQSDMFLIGSSKEADLRLGGEEIAGCHAALRYRSPHWYLCDLSGTGALKAGSEPIVESRIDGSLEVQVGTHRLKLFAKERNDSLFQRSASEGDRGLHQVVVRPMGIAERTPKTRASYDAVDTTPRPVGSAPTITGSPRSSGRSRCSIAA
jgi:hypothetical protein